MKILRILIPSILLLLQAGVTYSQDSLSLNTLVERNQKLIDEYPSEKVYLHFDKPYYAVGDTIWFKAYIAGGQDNPSDLSKIVYVDILSDKDTLVRSLRLPVVNTSAYGSLTLNPLTYKAGNYRIRAYTYWMLNFDEEYFFSRNLLIGNAIDRKVITNITLKGQGKDKSSQINANILYKDANGEPLKNSKVDWRVISKFETIARGRGTTDGTGALSLVLSANEKALLDTGVLETTVEVPESSPVVTSFPLKNSFTDADIQFFPEGGDLLEGIRGKVAFKAMNEKGLGLAVKGEIKDSSGKLIAPLTTQHSGMGIFAVTPEPGQTYTATVQFANGISKTMPLPAVKSSGIVMAATLDADNVLLRISSSAAYFSANQGKNYYVVARNKGIICYAAKATLTAPAFAASVPKNKFTTGIVQLTLFSAAGEPLTERLVFVKNPEILVLAANTDKKTYGARMPVKMNVSAKSGNAPVEGNFSVSVINETKVPFDENNDHTILSTFLLSSELRGYIENPNYYFTGINEKKLMDLDVLMLTQGYRKFSYKDIIAGKPPVISFLPEQGMEYTGTLRSANGMPVSRGSLKFVAPTSRFYAETTTDVNGVFKFKNVTVQDSAEVSITARNSTGSRNMMIMLDGSAFPSIGKNVNAPDNVLNIDSLLTPYLQNSQRQYRMTSQMLQEVVVKATAIKKVTHNDFPALSGLPMMADHVLDSERFKGCNFMLACLQTGAVGLTYAENNFFVTRVYNSGLKVPVQIFYDGMPVDANYLNNIVPADVESVEIFLKDELGLVNRTYGTNGVLSIYSKKDAKKPVSQDDLKKLFPPNNVLTFNPLGYLKSREFYSPKYVTAASRSVGSDLRTTVYWNPRVFTDKTGTFSFDFYNGDNKGTYKAVIEGTDIDGNLARYIYRYKVE